MEDNAVRGERRSRPRIRLINSDPPTPSESADLLPLAACDCDNDNATTKVNICIGDVEADVEACGVWG